MSWVEALTSQLPPSAQVSLKCRDRDPVSSPDHELLIGLSGFREHRGPKENDFIAEFYLLTW